MRAVSTEMEFKEILSMKGRRVLGINPPVEDFAFFDLWSKPAGLLYLLESMRLNGNEVCLLDCIHEAAVGKRSFGREKIGCTEIEKPSSYSGIKRKYHRFGLSDERITQRLAEILRPDVIFLTSGMTYWYGGVKRIISILKRDLPEVPVILGGTYAKLCPEHAKGLGADLIVSGHWIPDSPYPAMDLYEELPYGITMTSFGCPLSCSYCASRLLWPEYLRRPVLSVLREIQCQVSLGAKDFAFYDDALLLDKGKYFYPLCRELKSKYMNAIRFHTPNGLHVREIDQECALMLKETGFSTIRLSLESIDPKIAGAGSGKVAREEYIKAVRHLLDAGYSRNDCETYILLGLPGQDVDSVKQTIEFVRTAGGKPKLAEFSPIPGTSSFEAAAEKLPELRNEPLLHNNSVYSSWISKNISPQELQELKDLVREKA